jgi:hypothetical protein
MNSSSPIKNLIDFVKYRQGRIRVAIKCCAMYS